VSIKKIPSPSYVCVYPVCASRLLWVRMSGQIFWSLSEGKLTPKGNRPRS